MLCNFFAFPHFHSKFEGLYMDVALMLELCHQLGLIRAVCWLAVYDGKLKTL
jgi:hypothetical protein